MPYVFAVVSATWLGLLCSISPCPLAANVAAIGLIARNTTSPWRAVWAGVAYALGRAAAYVAIVAALVSGFASAPGLSHALQSRMGGLVGPMLIIVGAMLFGLVPLPSLPTSGWFVRLRARLASGNTLGTFALGAVLALALCPSSAALVFGGLLPLSIEFDSAMLLPTVFGGASALPVFAVALTLAFAANRTAKVIASLAAMERWSKRATATVCLVVGFYLTVTTL